MKNKLAYMNLVNQIYAIQLLKIASPLIFLRNLILIKSIVYQKQLLISFLIRFLLLLSFLSSILRSIQIFNKLILTSLKMCSKNLCQIGENIIQCFVKILVTSSKKCSGLCQISLKVQIILK